MPPRRRALCVLLSPDQFSSETIDRINLPSTSLYVRSIRAIGAIELMRKEFEGLTSKIPICTYIRIFTKPLAQIFGCTERQLYRLLKRAGFELNGDTCSGPVSAWSTTRDLDVAFLDLIAYAMAAQQRYNSCKVAELSPSKATKVLQRTYSARDNRKLMEEIWALFDVLNVIAPIVKNVRNGVFVMILREWFIGWFPDLAPILRAFT